MVGRATNDTFTNKTINAANNNKKDDKGQTALF